MFPCKYEMVAFSYVVTQILKDEKGPEVALHVFDLQFFDKDNLIVIYGIEGPSGKIF